MSKANANIRPGEILRDDFLGEMGITAYKLGQATGIPRSRLSDILAGPRGISAETAVRLGRFLTMTPQYWLNL